MLLLLLCDDTKDAHLVVLLNYKDNVDHFPILLVMLMKASVERFNTVFPTDSTQLQLLFVQR